MDSSAGGGQGKDTACQWVGSKPYVPTEESGRTSSPEPNCGYYLRGEHRLIRRHEESLSVNSDNTARWKLRVDLELPNHPEAKTPEAGTENFLFMFPLVYLRKNESRMLFNVFEEGKGPVPLPTRKECDDISAEAIGQAINFLASEIDQDFSSRRTN